jgi:transposase
MMSVLAGMTISPVSVQTTSNRGSTPEEIAARCVDKIVYVDPDSDQEALAKATELQARMTALIAHYISEAIKSDRSMVYHKLAAAGHTNIVELIRSF